MADQTSDKNVTEEALEIVRAARERLAYRQEQGQAGLDKKRLRKARKAARQRSGRQANPAEALRDVRAELGDCDRCPLCDGRTNIVFGAGDPYARIMFVGEGPGADEDRQGVPFVGKAGALLTKIIENGMKIPRSEVYIANIVKCRPPNNRDPEDAERETCFPFLVKQIEAIRPEVIIALGKVAAAVLTGDDNIAITRVRGEWREFNGIPLMLTLHPSYLLRNERAKGDVWEDIKLVMDKLGMDHS